MASQEIVVVLLASFLAPVLSAFITVGIVFSKVYIRTFVTDPFEFNTRTFKQYVRTVIRTHIPLSIIWGVVFILYIILGEPVTSSVLSQILAIMAITSIIAITSIVSYPQLINSKMLDKTTSFTPKTNSQKSILGVLVSIQLFVTILCFFGILTIF